MMNCPSSADSHRAEYYRRVGHAVEFLEDNPRRDVPLKELAEVSRLSRMHLNRIFVDSIGETVEQCAIGLRLRKAADALEQYRDKAVSEIGEDCGFASGSAFSLAFRQIYGCSPTKWRNLREIRGRTDRRNTLGHTLGCTSRVVGNPSWNDRLSALRTNTRAIYDISVKIVDMPDMNVASVRLIGPYQNIPKAFNVLFYWAIPLGLVNPDALIMGFYHDVPGDTPHEDMRSDACLSVPPGTTARAPVSIKQFNCCGKYACGYFEFSDPQIFPKAWRTMTSEWLPQSGYQFDERPTFEIYRGDPERRDGVFRMDICIPVKPL
jgi:AraC family transcriptional regulator